MPARNGYFYKLWLCPHCNADFKSPKGLTQHKNAVHTQRPAVPHPEREDSGPFVYREHPFLTGRPCNKYGDFLPPNASTVPNNANDSTPASWCPFDDRHDFSWAHFEFVERQSSAEEICKALDLWRARALSSGGPPPPWDNAQELYEAIDTIRPGGKLWYSYDIRYSGPLPRCPPKWMTETYTLCARDTRDVLHDQLSTTAFKSQMHTAPYQQFNPLGKRVYSNLFSGEWVWTQADEIAKDSRTHGAMFVPVVAGSDKTTVSVATGHQEYHPVYMSPGNITNTARRSHSNSVLPVAFLPIPKTRRQHQQTAAFQKFARQLYHACLARVFEPLKPGMTTPEVVMCPDGHYRRAVYGLGPYIADYPEQVWLAGVVQGWCPKCTALPRKLDEPGALLRTHEKTDFLITCFDPGTLWDDFGIRVDLVPFTHGFPRANIHELLSPDLLHQVIKGTFQDHIVTWVNEYLILTHGKSAGNKIMDDIDRRISLVPAFPGLRRFPDGRNFSQWTGDDSKALMKVYLFCIKGHVPSEMVKCLHAFLDICYIARRNALSTDDLEELEDTIARFHRHRDVFIATGVREDAISLPRQHSLKHLCPGMRLFGAANGLCSSITESKHIKAVKEPWRRSSRNNALFQMLKTICRMDKMAALYDIFASRRWMVGTATQYTAAIMDGQQPAPAAGGDGRDQLESEPEEDEYGAAIGPRVMGWIELARTPQRGYPRKLSTLAQHVRQPLLPELVRRFIWEELNPDTSLSSSTVPLAELPYFNGPVHVFHSATARFYAPSDLCGVGGMHKELIRSDPNWYGVGPRRDTVFVQTEDDAPGMLGMQIGRVMLFFSFSYQGTQYPCALVQWFIRASDDVDEDTGAWVVRPEYTANGRGRVLDVIHLDAIPRAAHLIGAYGTSFLPENLHYSSALDVWRSYFVNPYADHHMHEFLKV